MPTGIGGVNVRFGFDLGYLRSGIQEARAEIQKFHKNLTDIKLEAIIKGDPFRQTRNYLKAIRSEINDVFSDWRKTVTQANFAMGEGLPESKKRVDSLIQSWVKLKKTIESYAATKTISEERLKGGEAAAGGGIQRFIPPESRKEFTEGLEKLAKDIPEYSSEIRKWLKDFNNNITISSQEADKKFDDLNAILAESSKKLERRSKEFGTTIKKAFMMEKELNFQNLIKGAKDVGRALERNKERIRSMMVTEQELLTEVSKGINVHKNRAELAKLYQEYQNRGLKLTKEQSRLLEEVTAKTREYVSLYKKDQIPALSKEQQILRDRNKVVAQLLQSNANYTKQIKLGIETEENRQRIYNNLLKIQKLGINLNKEQLQVKRSIEKIDRQRERSSQITKILLENRKITAELKKQINVKQNINKLEKNIAQLQQMGWRISKNVTDQLNESKRAIGGMNERIKRFKRLGSDVRKDIKQTHDQANQLFSKKWFLNRARWFVQLRGMWAIWRRTTDAFMGAVQFEQEMANIKAITQATITQFEQLRQEALKVGSTTRFSAEEAAQAMVTMSQAGLDTLEIVDSLRSIAELATATLHDFKGTAEIVTTVMRSWGKSASEAQEIVDTLATATNETRLNMDRLATGFNYVAGIAPKAGMSLKETTAVLGLFANNGLRASTAATSLRAVIAELLKPSGNLKEELRKTGLTLEDVNPEFHTMEDIMLRLKEAGWGTAEAFRAFRRRGAAGASIWIENADKLGDLTNRMHQVGRAAAMSQENLAVTQGQWKQFGDVAIAVASGLHKLVSPTLQDLAKILATLTRALGEVLQPFAEFISTSSQGLRHISSIIKGQLGSTLLREDYIKPLQEATEELKKHEDQAQKLVDEFRNVRSAYMDFQKLIKKTEEVRSQKAVEGIMGKMVRLVKESKLLTEEELQAHIDINGKIKDRQKFYEAIEKSYKLRLKMQMAEWAAEMKLAEMREREARAMVAPVMDDLVQRVEDLGEDSGFRFGRKLLTGILRFITHRGRSGEVVKNLILGEEADFKTVMEDFEELLKALNQEQRQLIYEAYPSFWEAWLEASKEEDPKKAKELFLKVFEQGSGEIEGIVGEVEERFKKMWAALFPDEKDSIPRKEVSKAFIKIRDEIRKQIQTTLIAADAFSEYDRELNKIEASYDKLVDNIKDAEITPGEEERLLTLAEALRDMEISKLNATKKRIVEEKTEELDNKIRLLGIEDERTKKLEELEQQRKKDIEDLEYKSELEVKVNEYYSEQVRLLNLEYDLKEKILEKDIQIHGLELTQANLEEEGRDLEALKVERQVLFHELAKKQTELNSGINKDKEKQAKLQMEINEIQEKIADNTEKQKQETDIIHDLQTRLSDEMKKFKWSDTIYAGILKVRDGLSDFLYTATGGFQENKQKVIDLKAEYAEMEKDAQAASDALGEALAEEDIEKASELQNELNTINEEMSRLNEEIQSLEDPLDSVSESFRKFFKSLVDQIREAITQMIALQIVSSIFGAFEAKNTRFVDNWAKFPLSNAKGGILPDITAFRKFSEGGLTGNPTLALLGDNPSKKELVIPSENIQKDHVSGYTREKKETPVNIINVLTNEDVAQAMSTPPGERTIINMIGKDLRRQGPLYKQLKVA